MSNQTRYLIFDILEANNIAEWLEDMWNFFKTVSNFGPIKRLLKVIGMILIVALAITYILIMLGLAIIACITYFCVACIEISLLPLYCLIWLFVGKWYFWNVFKFVDEHLWITSILK